MQRAWLDVLRGGGRPDGFSGNHPAAGIVKLSSDLQLMLAATLFVAIGLHTVESAQQRPPDHNPQ